MRVKYIKDLRKVWLKSSSELLYFCWKPGTGLAPNNEWSRYWAVASVNDCPFLMTGIVKLGTKGGSNVSALPLKENKVQRWIPHGVDEDLAEEYVEAMQKYGPGYPDSGWFRRAAQLERQMHDVRLETKFDEN